MLLLVLLLLQSRHHSIAVLWGRHSALRLNLRLLMVSRMEEQLLLLRRRRLHSRIRVVVLQYGGRFHSRPPLTRILPKQQHNTTLYTLSALSVSVTPDSCSRSPCNPPPPLAGALDDESM